MLGIPLRVISANGRQGLSKIVKKYDPEVSFIRSASELRKGDILFILSCDQILSEKQLSLHKNIIVVHASDLPKGRGWSPWTWQVEIGQDTIPLTLFEASQECDAGDYYLKDSIKLEGTELIDAIRREIAGKVIAMVGQYLNLYPMQAIPQKGKATYYRKRKKEDNELSIQKSIKNQFNKMRVADNERYPLHFRIKGKKYVLKIYNAEE